MYVVLFAFLALASAAPQYRTYVPFGRPHQSPQRQLQFRNYGAISDGSIDDSVLDVERFWKDFETEMQQLETVLQEVTKHFAESTSTAGIVNNEYVITMTMTGFDEGDIKVKAREGVIMVQAVHQYEDGIGQRSVLDIKPLPSYVNVNGSWTYEKETLKIVFPLNSNPGEVTTVQPDTNRDVDDQSQEENKSREEMDKNNNGNTNQDADVGLERGDKDNDIMTNEISRNEESVDTTTYAVDLKNEVEFVPVRY